jgi:hypothetical protein
VDWANLTKRITTFVCRVSMELIKIISSLLR